MQIYFRDFGGQCFGILVMRVGFVHSSRIMVHFEIRILVGQNIGVHVVMIEGFGIVKKLTCSFVKHLVFSIFLT